jgi:hypothetical protein
VRARCRYSGKTATHHNPALAARERHARLWAHLLTSLVANRILAQCIRRVFEGPRSSPTQSRASGGGRGATVHQERPLIVNDASYKKNLPPPRPATARPSLPPPRPLSAPPLAPSPSRVALGPRGAQNPSVPLPSALRDPGRLARVLRGREVPRDAEDDLFAVLGWASSQIARVAAGEFSHRRAPTILKAASALLDEAVGKLAEKQHHSGSLMLAAAVQHAANRIAAEERTALPPPEEGSDAA